MNYQESPWDNTKSFYPKQPFEKKQIRSNIYDYQTTDPPSSSGLNKNAPAFKYSTPQKNDWDFTEKPLYPNYSQQKPEGGGPGFVSKKSRHKKKKLTYDTPQSEDDGSGHSYGSAGSNYQYYGQQPFQYYQSSPASPYDFQQQTYQQYYQNNNKSTYSQKSFYQKPKYIVKQPSLVKPFVVESVPVPPPVTTPTPSVSSQSSSQSTVVRKKYESCKNFREKGVCKYGDRCLFAHGDHELTKRGSDEDEKPPVKQPPLEVVAEATIESTKDETVQPVETSKENTSEEEIQDHGENSTTLSSIEHQKSATSTPEKTGSKAFFEQSFKKEEEFKEMLDNLDIENIEIVLSARPQKKIEDQLEKDLNLDIEKLLSEEDEDVISESAPLDDRTLKSIGNNFSTRTRRLQIFEEITVDEEK